MSDISFLLGSTEYHDIRICRSHIIFWLCYFLLSSVERLSTERSVLKPLLSWHPSETCSFCDVIAAPVYPLSLCSSLGVFTFLLATVLETCSVHVTSSLVVIIDSSLRYIRKGLDISYATTVTFLFNCGASAWNGYCIRRLPWCFRYLLQHFSFLNFRSAREASSVKYVTLIRWSTWYLDESVFDSVWIKYCERDAFLFSPIVLGPRLTFDSPSVFYSSC